MKKEKYKYANLIHCHTAEEVRASVREWSSSVSDQDHLIRSTILDIHTNVERTLRQILYQYMLPLIFQGFDEQENIKSIDNLKKTIEKMNFSGIYRFLKPCLDAFSHPDLSHIQAINDVRNQVAHRDIEKVSYKDRNPFRDFDCLAQLFLESWAAKQILAKFYERMIADPRAIAEMYEKYYKEHEE